MLLSYKHQFIFVHVLKTAGTSVAAKLAPHARYIDALVYGYRPTVKLFTIFNILTNRKGIEFLTGFTKHATALEIRKKLPFSLYNSCFKFAFVRNPWDWCVSLYFYLRQNPQLPGSKVASQKNFSDFIKQRVESHPPRQIDYIADNLGNIIIDYVAKYEQLESEFNHISNKLGLTTAHLPRENVSRHRRGNDYRLYYDDETCEIVGQYFKADVEQFNYKFD